MNKEIKDRWTTALRSGAYKQGRYKLCYNDKYCCLGVLCDILKNELDLKIEVYESNIQLHGKGLSFDNEKTVLPEKICSIARIDNIGNIHELVDGCASLMGLNDIGKSFMEIADIIEDVL